MWFSSLRLSALNFSGAAERDVVAFGFHQNRQWVTAALTVSKPFELSRDDKSQEKIIAFPCEALWREPWRIAYECLWSPWNTVLLQDNFGALRSVGALGGWIVFARCHLTWKPKELGGNLSNFKSYIYVHTFHICIYRYISYILYVAIVYMMNKHTHIFSSAKIHILHIYA